MVSDPVCFAATHAQALFASLEASHKAQPQKPCGYHYRWAVDRLLKSLPSPAARGGFFWRFKDDGAMDDDATSDDDDDGYTGYSGAGVEAYRAKAEKAKAKARAKAHKKRVREQHFELFATLLDMCPEAQSFVATGLVQMPGLDAKLVLRLVRVVLNGQAMRREAGPCEGLPLLRGQGQSQDCCRRCCRVCRDVLEKEKEQCQNCCGDGDGAGARPSKEAE